MSRKNSLFGREHPFYFPAESWLLDRRGVGPPNFSERTDVPVLFRGIRIGWRLLGMRKSRKRGVAFDMQPDGPILRHATEGAITKPAVKMLCRGTRRGG